MSRGARRHVGGSRGRRVEHGRGGASPGRAGGRPGEEVGREEQADEEGAVDPRSHSGVGGAGERERGCMGGERSGT